MSNILQTTIVVCEGLVFLIFVERKSGAIEEKLKDVAKSLLRIPQKILLFFFFFFKESPFFLRAKKKNLTKISIFCLLAWRSCLRFRKDCMLSGVCVRAGVFGVVTCLCFGVCPCPSIMYLSLLMRLMMDGLQSWQVLPECL